MNISRNPITLEEHVIPSGLDDSKAIRDFIDRNSGKKIVVVQGLGNVRAIKPIE